MSKSSGSNKSTQGSRSPESRQQQQSERSGRRSSNRYPLTSYISSPQARTVSSPEQNRPIREPIGFNQPYGLPRPRSSYTRYLPFPYCYPRILISFRSIPPHASLASGPLTSAGPATPSADSQRPALSLTLSSM
jgi:hypothetical protein